MKRFFLSCIPIICNALALGPFCIAETPPAILQNSESTAAAATASVASPSPKAIRRYNPLKDPLVNREAAKEYYNKRQELLKDFYGESFLSKLTENTDGQKEPLLIISYIETYELFSAIPIADRYLRHSDALVRGRAAEVLCSFGLKRGFDFILEQRKQKAGMEWNEVFTRVFIGHKPAGYSDALAQMMIEKNGATMAQKVDALSIAQVLCVLGDPRSLDLLSLQWQKSPPETPGDVLQLVAVRDGRAKDLAQAILDGSKNARVIQAAEVVLASFGAENAQSKVLSEAGKVIKLPQPQKPDGNSKDGMVPKFVGEATPAWDNSAVFALEHGLELLPPEKAIPMLREIGMNAENVRFSSMAAKILAKFDNPASREALIEIAQSLKVGHREFKETIYTTVGQALLLNNDATSESLAQQLFGGDLHGFKSSKFIAETRGWRGLFDSPKKY